MDLTKNEFLAICDATNGLFLTDNISVRDQIILEVEDTIKLDGLDKKWNLDKTFLEKLNAGDEKEFKKLWAEIGEFWASKDKS